jgi:hypothetical protein
LLHSSVSDRYSLKDKSPSLVCFVAKSASRNDSSINEMRNPYSNDSSINEMRNPYSNDSSMNEMRNPYSDDRIGARNANLRIRK